MSFYDVIETVGKTIDGVGVAVIAAGVLISAVVAIVGVTRQTPDVYRRLREQMGRSILLGLEFLIAGDIIRTVAVTPDLRSLAVLGGIVAIRTFLTTRQPLEVTGSRPREPARARRIRTKAAS